MSNTSNQYVESLFDSVNILINKSLENVSYDSTIICTIVDDSNSKNGEYRVTDGSVTYTAYADNNKYLKGDQVRVSIPMGNIQDQKFIIGKYTSDNDSNPITYISPDDTILNITGNLISSSNIKGGIVANGTDTSRVLWNNLDVEDSFRAMQDSDIYNTVILKANFRTSFRNTDIVSGNYGLKIDFKVRPSTESSVYLRRSVELDCSEMFGNPYNFSIKSPQAKIFKINTIGIIEAMELSLYQKGNFMTRNNGALTVIKDRDGNEVDNIFVTDIVLGFGSDLATIEDNSLQIYTSDPLSYVYGNHNNSTNKKNIGLLWYNKDEDNKYIGFSDGVYQADYDELIYLAKAKLDNRLTAQKGKEFIPEDKISLNLAANLEEALPRLKKAIDIVNQDLIQLLRELQVRVSDVAEYNTNINRLISSAEPNSGESDYRISKMAQDIETLIGSDSSEKGLVPQYKAVLKYGYQIWKGLTPDPEWSTEENTLWPKYTGSTNYVEQNNYNIQISQKLNNIQSAIDWLFGTNSTQGFAGITSTYSGYKSIYDAYKLRAIRLMATMWGYLGRAEIKFGPDYESYDKYFPQSVLFTTTETNFGYDNNTDFDFLYQYKNKSKDSYTLYKAMDLSMYDNRYCIYWYRYEQGYIPPDTEQLLPNGWKRLTADELKETAIGDSDGKNVGLSSIYYYDDNSDLRYRYKKTSVYNANRKYYTKTTTNNVDNYTLVSNPTRTNVKNGQYYVRVCVNDDGKWVHAPKVSNGNGLISRYMQNDLTQEKYMAVLFYNHNMYKSNELVFTNSEVVPDKTTLDKGDILIFEHLTNSSDSYQSYSITNYLMDASDEDRSRQIRCHYDGLLAKDNAFIGGSIYWYVPNTSTMLAVDVENLTGSVAGGGRGFTLDTTRSEYGYQEIPLDKTIYDRKEKDYYIKNTAGDYIKATGAFNSNKTYFEKICTTYCFYKRVEGYKKSDDEITQDMFEWDKWNYHKENEEIDNRDFWYKIKPYYVDSAVRNEIQCVFLKEEDIDEVQGVQLFKFGVKGTSGTKYTLAVTRDTTQKAATPDAGLPLVAELKDFDNQVLSLTNDASDFDVNWIVCGISTDEITEDSNIITKVYGNTASITTPKKYFGLLDFTAKIMLKGTELEGQTEDKTSVGKTRTVDLNVIYAVPYTTGNYYIKGPTQIIYNSLGTLDNNSMFNTSYQLFTENTDALVENVVWSIDYYKINNKKFVKITDADELKFYRSYMPVLSHNNLVPSPMYLENLDCYAVVTAKKNNSILWRQPIIILQNRYASSMLNDWDGSLTIDEKNGTILSSMVGAGRKTENNTFEGVLMGNVALGTASGTGFEKGNAIGLSNQTGLGLYGFNDGAQSFGFNIDGTAFLGKSGSGRIIFNGNAGTIASSKWYTSGGQINSNPTPENPSSISSAGTEGMCIDLESGHIDAYNFKLTSNNIYLNSSPGDGHVQNSTIRDPYKNYYLRIGEEHKTGFIGLDNQGNLEIRVNSMQFTAELGNENLFLQTSPRKSVNVPHWNEYKYTKRAEIDAEGNITKASEESLGYKSYPYDADGNYHYTWGLDSWTNSQTSGVSSWVRTSTYAQGAKVTRLNNLWIAKSSVNANELPPGNSASAWEPQIEVIDTDNDTKPNTILVKGNNTQLYQVMKLKDKTKYTVSGYVRSTEANKIFGLILGSQNQYEIYYSNLDDDTTFYETMEREWTLKDDKWHYVKCTFITPGTSSSDKSDRRLGFTCQVPFELWHAKLEEGSIATTWNPAPSDVDVNIETSTTQYDYYLNQDRTFEKLFKDKKTGLMADGFAFTQPEKSVTGLPELYINASYIATGILRSKNWDGKLEVTRTNSEDKFEYKISSAPKFGMYMDLNEGKVWAAKFELNAWDYDNAKWDSKKEMAEKGKGLYLNSDPDLSPNSNHQYYLKLGDLTKSYITFDAHGNLKMRVNSFELTSTFGGTNLLNDTKPRGADGTDVRNILVDTDSSESGVQPAAGAHWAYNVSKIKAVVSISDNVNVKGEALRIHNLTDVSTSTSKYRSIYQDIKRLNQSTQYILSGWVYVPTPNQKIYFRIKPTADAVVEDSVTYSFQAEEGGKWYYISHIFEIDNTYTAPRFYIIDFNLSTFTTNSQNEKVIDKKYCTYFHHLKLEQGTVATQWEESEQDKLDTLDVYNTETLLQDAVFNKLTNNGTTKGIFLKDKELYINATYLASSIIRSSNWKAQYELENSKGEAIKHDLTSNGSAEGKFDQTDLTQILELYPDARIVNIKPTAGMYINLDDGKIWAKNFELDAATETTKTDNTVRISGLYLNNAPVYPDSADAELTKENYYLVVGDTNSNYIGFARIKNEKGTNTTSLTLKSKIFNLQTGNKDKAGYISINSDASKDSEGNYNAKPLVIGKNFSVDWNGNLVVNGATFNGKITSNSTIESATITGGTISGTSIIGSGIYARPKGSTTNTFSVDGTTGHMVCNSATIGGWTVDPDSISGNGISMSGTKGISSDYWNVGANGDTTITNLKVTNSLTVNWAPSSKASRAAVTPDHVGGGGSTGGGDSTPAAMVSIAGNTTIGGTVTIGTSDVKTSLTVNGTTNITGDLTIPSGDHIVLASGGGDDGKSSITLLEYIKANSDTLIDFSLFGDTTKNVIDLSTLFSKDPIVYSAKTLCSGIQNTVTLTAPTSAPTKAGFLRANGASKGDTATSWSSISASDITCGDGDTGKVLVSSANGASWKTMGATLVNFTDTTTVNGPYTSGTEKYYKVKVPYTKIATKSEEITVSGKRYYKTTGVPDSNGKLTSIECSEWEALNRDTSVYPYYGWVSYSGSKTVTVADPDNNSTGYVYGDVQINISLS